jgi:hypothetical protein
VNACVEAETDAMTSYMPQHLFDMAVVTTVKIHTMTGEPLSQNCSQICQRYQSSFPDDASIERDLDETSQHLLRMMRSQFKDEQLPAAMTQLQFCITNYELNGRKKRKRLLGGTWFTRSKFPNPNRAKNCLQNIMVYYTGTMTGMFPLAPSDWSLEDRQTDARGVSPSAEPVDVWMAQEESGAPLIISDTERTLNEVRKLPEPAQRVIAMSVYKKIVRSLRQIEGTPGPSSPERDRVIRDQLNHAKAARHRALSRGARNWADPDWATAAIIESWLMANCGALGRKAFDEITSVTMSWLRSVLSDSDVEKIEQS